MRPKHLSLLLGVVIALTLLGVACASAPTQSPTPASQAKPAAQQAAPTQAAAAAPAQPAQAAAAAQPAQAAQAKPATTGKKRKFAFLAGVQDPFYYTIQRGAQLAANELGIELITQIPSTWNTTVQAPMLDALVARGDLDFLFLAPTDKEAMVAPLKKASDTGLPILTVDTYIGDGDYANGPVKFPLS